jgi:glycine dehydrogenase
MCTSAMPGRLVGVTIDAQAIRRTARAPDARAAHPPREGDVEHLHGAGAAAVIASMYAVYHGPEGLATIARRGDATAIARPAGARREGAHAHARHAVETGERTTRSTTRRSARHQPAPRRRDLGRPVVDTTSASAVERLFTVFCGDEAPKASRT